MFCSHCGKEIPDVDICPLCGCYARNAVQVNTVPSASAAPSYSRPRKNGKGTAARFWGKTLCLLGAGANLLLVILDNPDHYMHCYVGAFENIFYYIAGAIAVVTAIAAAIVFFNARRSSLKKYIPIPIVLGILASIGGVYGYLYEFYSPDNMVGLLPFLAIGMIAVAVILLVAAILTRKNILNLFAFFSVGVACLFFYEFFGSCMINKYYRGELFFMIGVIDIACFALVMLLMQGAYNSDKRFDEASAAETEEVAVNE